MEIPIVHKLADLYKNIYRLGKNLPKQDRFGLHLKIESICLDCLRLSITAALSAKEEKTALLNKLKIEIETIKHLIRLEQELQIIKTKTYFFLQNQLQEISKMATGWIRYLKQKGL